MFTRLRSRWRRDARPDDAVTVDRRRRRLAAVEDEVVALLLDEGVPGRGQRLRALDLAAADLRREIEALGGDPITGSGAATTPGT